MFFAYTPPLPAPVQSALADALLAPHSLTMAFLGLGSALAALAVARLPRRVSSGAPAPQVAQDMQQGGPVFDPTVNRWRHPVTRRFVKAPVGATA